MVCLSPTARCLALGPGVPMKNHAEVAVTVGPELGRRERSWPFGGDPSALAPDVPPVLVVPAVPPWLHGVPPQSHQLSSEALFTQSVAPGYIA